MATKRLNTIIGIKSNLVKYAMTLATLMVLTYLILLVTVDDKIALRLDKIKAIYFGFAFSICGGSALYERFFHKK